MVISMTLAELFLMLLFVVWYGFTPVSGDAELARLKDTVARLEQEVTAARKTLAENKKQIEDLTARLDWWRKRYPTEAADEGKPPAAPGGLGDGKRGHGKCAPDNVLIEASVQQGNTSLRVLARPPEVVQSFEKLGATYPDVKVWLDEPDVERFLASLRRVNASAMCRWDFRLYYETKVDGFDGLERFQLVFYLARKFQASRPE
jgi:uncharacterized coiled-coil protein SlyX